MVPDVKFLERPKEVVDAYNENMREENADSDDEDKIIDSMFEGFTKTSSNLKEEEVKEEIKEIEQPKTELGAGDEVSD